MNRADLFAFALLIVTWGLPAVTVGQQTVPPAKVIGRDNCKICHVSEYKTWEKSAHNTNAWKLLDDTKAEGFAKAIGVDNIKTASACTQCHGTPQLKRGLPFIAQGNSCESCHGGAGPIKDGWYLEHMDFGSGRKLTDGAKMADWLADRAKETKDHREARDAACDKLGMNRSENAFDLAANCLNCHLVPNEKLFAAGHPMSTRFEFVEWAQGEVRHNFLLDASKNAEAPTNWTDQLRNGAGRTDEGRKRLMTIAGQMADLAVSLKIRATVVTVKRRTLGDEVNDRILDRKEELEDHEIAALQPVLAAVAKINKKILREVPPNNNKTIAKAAADVTAAAKKFVAAYQDGKKLPDSIKVSSKEKGDVFKPAGG